MECEAKFRKHPSMPDMVAEMRRCCGSTEVRGLGEPSAREGNLLRLFGIVRAPSDSWMRERLDVLDAEELRRPFKLLSLAQRGAEEYEWLGGRHMLSVDGTGCFSSPTVHCDNCCKKNRRHGSVEYCHQSCNDWQSPVRGAGASGAPGGGSAGADPEGGRREEERLRAQAR